MKQQTVENYKNLKSPIEKRVGIRKGCFWGYCEKHKGMPKENIKNAVRETESILKSQSKERSEKVPEDTERMIIIFLGKVENNRISPPSS